MIPQLSDELLKLDNQFCFVVYALSRKITAHYRPLLQELGLTYPQYLVMLVLWERHGEGETGSPIKFLCERLMLDTGTLTPLLKRLEGSGWIQRARAEEDERSIIVSLTPSGLDLKEQARDIPGKLVCQLSLPLDELVAVKQQLETLLRTS